MFKPYAIFALALLVLGGCSTTKPISDSRIVPESKVVVVDPDKLDREIYGDKLPEPTPDHVMVGTKDGVIIDVDKKGTEHDPQHDIELQVWKVTATNMNHDPKCVTLMWQLMDFEYISFGPSEQLVRGEASHIMGEMKQQFWIIEGAKVTFPPSGFLSNMRVRNPVAGAKIGEECMHLTPEEDIKEW
jgi:hypothetical protein